MKKHLKKIAIALGISADLSAEEKLINLTNEQRQENLINDILRIRRIGGYIPDYNKPPVNVEYPIQLKVITACERPVDFGNNILGWVESIKLDHKQKVAEEKAKQEKFEKIMQERTEAVNKIMAHFLTVD